MLKPCGGVDRVAALRISLKLESWFGYIFILLSMAAILAILLQFIHTFGPRLGPNRSMNFNEVIFWLHFFFISPWIPGKLHHYKILYLYYSDSQQQYFLNKINSRSASSWKRKIFRFNSIFPLEFLFIYSTYKIYYFHILSHVEAFMIRLK